MKLILASGSPRRRELLSKLDYPFEVIPSNCEELTNATDPVEVVQQLAERKAREVYASNRDCIVIGCDTVVDFNGQILGKPADAADATRMLNALSGNEHFVHTGVCVLSPKGETLFCDSTKVRFRKLSSEEIARYVASGEAFGKAGAYGIQDDSHFAVSYDGDYDNVVGLPTYKVQQILAEIYKRC